MSNSRPPFPIFVGSGRSGTTLVQAIFSSHPDLAIVHESRFIPLLAGRDYMANGQFGGKAFAVDLQRVQGFAQLEIDAEKLARDLETDPPADYADAVRRVFAMHAAGQNKTRFGDKSPGSVLYIDQLAGILPEARFVHVVRDGRDVAMSYLERKFGPKTLEEAALYWRRRVMQGHKAGTQLGPERYRVLLYEELIADPEGEVRRLCPFLGLEYDDAMLRYYEHGAQIRSKTADPEAHGSLTLPPTKGLRDWRTQMSRDDVSTFEVLAGGALETFGYERQGRRPSLSVAMRAASGWARWNQARVLNRVRRSGSR